MVFAVDAIADTGATMAVMSGTGENRFVVGTREQGGLINLMNNQGRAVLIAGTADEGLGGALSIKNGAGQLVLHAGYDSVGDGLVTVWDTSGKRNAEVSARR